MQPMSITLFLTEGSSDKQYQVQLEQSGAGFVVNYQNGRRGSTLRRGTKTKLPLPYDSARAIYDKLVKEKMKKGYTEDEGGQSFVGTEDAGRDSGVRPMLLNPVDDAQVEALLADPAWCAEVKFDGERRMVIIDKGAVTATNRRGLAVPMSAELHAALLAAPFFGRTVLDGEDLGDMFVVFDVLCINGRDVTALPYRERLDVRRNIHGIERGVFFAPTALTTEDKSQLLDSVIADRGEGIVLKRLDAPYVAGRPSSGGPALKYKLVETCTARVASQNPGKRSVALELIDADGKWTVVGNVTVPANKAIPEPGSLVEVRYLYAYEGGSLFQPVLLGRRVDLSEEDCTLDQLKYKGQPIAA